MKLVTIIATLAILCAVAIAQQPQPAASGSGAALPARFSPPALPENYVLVLTVSDKEQILTEFTLVIATADFKASFADLKSGLSSFAGTVTLEEGGTILVRYGIGIEFAVQVSERQVQHKATATESSVRLRLGEPVQLLKSDLRSYRLSISRLADQGSKPK